MSKDNRITSFFCDVSELKSTGTAHHFAFLLNSTDYRILRMDEDHDRMYVGSKDYILSLDLNDINKEPLIVRVFCYTTTNKIQYSIFNKWFMEKMLLSFTIL